MRGSVDQVAKDFGGTVSDYRLGLLHHAHVCQTSGDSVRLSQALNGQGVSPLN